MSRPIDTEKSPASERERIRRWHLAHRDNLREANRRYYAKHPEKSREKNRRKRATPEGRLEDLCRSRILKFTKGIDRSEHTRELIGCSWGFLRNHLEASFELGWTWENHGDVWHVDHVVPLSWFRGLLSDPEWQRVAFHWSNLQPLSAEENMKKGNRRCELIKGAA
jgi:hypothetical protein